jgi:hypothetical protein
VTLARVSAVSKYDHFSAPRSVVIADMTNLSFDIYLRATPQQVRTVLTEPTLVPSWLAGMSLHPGEEEDPRRLSCEWLQTEHLEINGGISSVVRFDLVEMGQVTRLTVKHLGLEPGGSLLNVITPGWPMILSSLKSLMETGEPLHFLMKLLWFLKDGSRRQT